MPLPSSGPLTLAQIQGEFGGSNPISLSEYYAGGGLVPAGTSGTYGAVPSSGTISIQNFYGTSNVTYWLSLLGDSGTSISGTNGITVSSGNDTYNCSTASRSGYLGSWTFGLVVKINASGVVQWQRAFYTGTSDVTFSRCGTDSSGNLYVAAKVNFRFTLVKIDSSGNLVFATGLDFTAGGAVGLAVDSSGNSYLVGTTGASSTLIAKFNSSGTLQWQNTHDSGFFNTFLVTVGLDPSGNAYYGGYDDYSGWYAYRVAKVNSSGTLQWQRVYTAAGVTNLRSTSLAVDGSGNVYMCGRNDAPSAVTIKYDTNGNLQWQQAYNDAFGYGVTCSSSGDVYSIGGNSDFSSGFIAKYNASGTLQWQRRMSSPLGWLFFTEAAVASGGALHIYGNVGIYRVIDKLPNDGSKTGSYTVGGNTVTYSAGTNSTSTPSYSSAASTWTYTGAGYSTVSPSLSATTVSPSITYSVTTI